MKIKRVKPDPRAAAAFAALRPDDVRVHVNAVLAERGVSGVELGRRMGRTQPWISRRTSGRVAWSAGELVLVADALGIDARKLVPDLTPAGV